MGFQTLQVEDDLGNKYQLGVQKPDGSYTIGVYDDSSYEILRQSNLVSSTAVGSATTPGTRTVATPAAGKSIRVKWIRLKSIGNNGTNKFTLRLGTNVLYSETLDEIDAWQHGALHEGGVDEILTLETSASQTLEYNIEYEEF